MNSRPRNWIMGLIVVAAFGVVASISVPSMIGSVRQMREAEVKRQCGLVQIAVERFTLHNDGVFPASLYHIRNGRIVLDYLPKGEHLNNPFSSHGKGWWSAVLIQGVPGSITYRRLYGDYQIHGYGHDASIPLVTLTRADY